jgi:putative two-component system response regulator
MSIKILLVDDSESDMMILESILSDYELLKAYNGLEAIGILKNDSQIDMMILDLTMPVMNGFEVLDTIKKEFGSYNISIIILTNSEELENEIKGLENGAVDYIRKPLNFQSLRKRIEIHTRLRSARQILSDHNALLEQIVRERTKELAITRDITVHALVKLLEVRNIESSNHALRTQELMKALCLHLSKKERYSHILTEEYINELYDTAPLHDIGKVGIPDCILLKPARLTPEEFEIMKQHTTYGVEAIRYDVKKTGSFSFLHTATCIIGEHHERYDGTGYPKGLRGEEISLPGRLMSIIDVYDALISERVYKPPFDHALALEELKKGSGTQFDPDLLEAFFDISDTVYQIKTFSGQNS